MEKAIIFKAKYNGCRGSEQKHKVTLKSGFAKVKQADYVAFMENMKDIITPNITSVETLDQARLGIKLVGGDSEELAHINSFWNETLFRNVIPEPVHWNEKNKPSKRILFPTKDNALQTKWASHIHLDYLFFHSVWKRRMLAVAMYVQNNCEGDFSKIEDGAVVLITPSQAFAVDFIEAYARHAKSASVLRSLALAAQAETSLIMPILKKVLFTAYTFSEMTIPVGGEGASCGNEIGRGASLAKFIRSTFKIGTLPDQLKQSILSLKRTQTVLMETSLQFPRQMAMYFPAPVQNGAIKVVTKKMLERQTPAKRRRINK